LKNGLYFILKNNRNFAMAMIKEQAISLIQSLPSKIDFEDIHYHLYVQEKT